VSGQELGVLRGDLPVPADRLRRPGQDVARGRVLEGVVIPDLLHVVVNALLQNVAVARKPRQPCGEKRLRVVVPAPPDDEVGDRGLAFARLELGDRIPRPSMVEQQLDPLLDDLGIRAEVRWRVPEHPLRLVEPAERTQHPSPRRAVRGASRLDLEQPTQNVQPLLNAILEQAVLGAIAEDLRVRREARGGLFQKRLGAAVPGPPFDERRDGVLAAREFERGDRRPLPSLLDQPLRVRRCLLIAGRLRFRLQAVIRLRLGPAWG
jgi:hypothetical protein